MIKSKQDKDKLRDEIRSLKRQLSERKRGEKKLHDMLGVASDERFRALADNLLDVIMRFDRQFRHLYVNKYVEKQTGIPAEQFIGKTHRELGFPQHLCQLWEEAIQKVFAAKQMQRIEFELPSHIWIDWLLMPEFDKNGAVKFVITAAREITERKLMEKDLERRVAERTCELQLSNLTLQTEISERRRTENALRESEKKYRSLFEESQDMVYITTPDGRYLDINPAGVAMLGFSSKDELLLTPVADCYLDPEKRLDFMERINRNGFIKDFEVTLKRRDGKPLQVLITGTSVKDAQGRVQAYRGIIRDITERRRLEQQLFQVQKMESIGTLAGGIAHDFNNILGGILGYASLMKSKLPPDHPFIAYVDTIERGAQRAAELTSKLLAFAMGTKYHIEPVNINDVIGETIRIVSRLFDRSLELKTILAEDLPTVDADASLIQQVIMNLLVNARDAMPQGGELLVETMRQEVDEEYQRGNIEAHVGEYAVISVSDTGSGMDLETIQRIFEPFFSTKEKGKGTGLGLAIVYGVVKNHGGFVRVYSEPGKGSTFRVYLPVSGRPLEKSKHLEERQRLYGTEHILVVDDEDDIRTLTRDAFEEYGYHVLLANDGEEGCELYESNQQKIDLVLLDMVMPRLGGLETYLRLRELNPEVKVILSSGYSQNGKAKEILNLGVLGFIQKPYQVQQLLTTVRRVLDVDAKSEG